MKLLIAYGTKEGQTRKICKFLKKEAQRCSHQVELIEIAKSHHNSEEFDAIIVGTPLHNGKFHPEILRLLQRNEQKLKNVPGILVAVSSAAASDDPKSRQELKQITQSLLEETGWQPHHIEHVAGVIKEKVPKSEPKLPKSRRTEPHAKRTREFTDWDQVKKIVPDLERKIKKAWSESSNPTLYCPKRAKLLAKKEPP